jgi:outer membrane protein assembly factor BamA
MTGFIRTVFFPVLALVVFLSFSPLLSAQAPPVPDTATARLREVHADGQKFLTEAQIAAITGLQPGTQVGRADLQSGADNLMQSGLFAKVSYTFKTAEGVTVTYHVEESLRVPVYFDNIPWFADSELNDAIAKKLPFYNGTLPDGGNAVDQATAAINELLASRGLQGTLTHQLLANPLGDGNVQSFHIEGAALQISKLEFGDPSLAGSKTVQQHLSEVVGKPYSRMTIDLFLTEQIRPIYQQLGFLRAKLGPPEVRLTGKPTGKLPDQIPVFIPIIPGSVYRWKSTQWSGNSIVSTITLDNLMGLKSGDTANGMEVEAAWDRVREEYGHHGFLDAKVDAETLLDDETHTVSYKVTIQEGVPYKFERLVITGISPAAERRILQVWTMLAGDVFDKAKYEDFLTKLQVHPAQIFGDLPLHYDTVGHWLQTDTSKSTVDVLLDFK